MLSRRGGGGQLGCAHNAVAVFQLWTRRSGVSACRSTWGRLGFLSIFSPGFTPEILPAVADATVRPGAEDTVAVLCDASGWY